MYEETREHIAKEIYDVWKEAKEDCDDNWDDITFESLPEKHIKEYYLTVEALLAIIFTPAQIAEWKAGGKVAVIARDHDKSIVLLLASHYFGSLPDGRDTFAFTQEELLELRVVE